MQHIDLIEKHVSTALFQFISPFSLKANTTQNLLHYLQKEEFTPFELKDVQKETEYYGSYHVSHREMEAYFPPLTTNILFPTSQQQKGFQRFTKKLDIKAQLKSQHGKTPFQIHSVDFFVCPFDLGLLTLRAELNSLSFSQSIEFADCIRILEPQLQKSEIEFEGKMYPTIKEFLFDLLFPQLRDYFNDDSVSFLETQEMYVQSMYSIKEGENIEPVDVYRSGTFCGLTDAGKPYVNANNLEYISTFIKENTYNRLAPTTYFLVHEKCLSCMTSEEKAEIRLLTKQFYGPIYYTVLINLFHQVLLLKIANNYSVIKIEKDKKKIQDLIYTINSFTSNYFFSVYPIKPDGQELFKLLRKSFSIDFLYANTKDILFSLFKYEENNVTSKDSLLLLVLTLYTVICGIFSMNLFTHDLMGKINWNHFKTYNPFEYFAVFIVLSGIIVVATLGLQSLYQGFQNRKSQKKRAQKTILPSKKQ